MKNLIALLIFTSTLFAAQPPDPKIGTNTVWPKITTIFTQGSVGFADSVGRATQDNANFFWDDSNNRLGIGIAVPLQALDVVGNGHFTGGGRFQSLMSSAAGSGLELGYFAGGDYGTINAYDRTGGAYRELRIDGLVTVLNSASTGQILIGTSSATGGKVQVRSTTEQLRLEYDGTQRLTATVNSSGNVTFAPSGGTVNVTGAMTASGVATGSGGLTSGSNGYIQWDSRTFMRSPSTGVIAFYDDTLTNFTRFQLGGTNVSNPAIQANGTGIDIVLANGSAFTAIQSLYDRFGSGSPEGAVTAPVGAVYHRTDGGAGTSFYVKESGAGNTGWVAK